MSTSQTCAIRKQSYHFRCVQTVMQLFSHLILEKKVYIKNDNHQSFHYVVSTFQASTDKGIMSFSCSISASKTQPKLAVSIKRAHIQVKSISTILSRWRNLRSKGITASTESLLTKTTATVPPPNPTTRTM